MRGEPDVHSQFFADLYIIPSANPPGQLGISSGQPGLWEFELPLVREATSSYRLSSTNPSAQRVPKMRCNGCLKRFKKPSGLWRHMSRSKNPACEAAYIAQRSYLPGHTNDGNPSPPPTIPGPTVSPVPGNSISMSTVQECMLTTG